MDLAARRPQKIRRARREAWRFQGLLRLSVRLLCTSVNEEIVHGIPSENGCYQAGGYRFRSIGGVVLDGYYGDAASPCRQSTIRETGSSASCLDGVTEPSLCIKHRASAPLETL